MKINEIKKKDILSKKIRVIRVEQSDQNRGKEIDYRYVPRVLGIPQEKLEIHNGEGTPEKNVRIPTRQNSRVISRAEFERVGVNHPELRHPRLAPIHLHPYFDPLIDHHRSGTFSTSGYTLSYTLSSSVSPLLPRGIQFDDE